MAKIKVTVTGLYSLTVNKQFVEPAIILNESKALYKALKLEGADGVDVVYNESGEKDWYTSLPRETKAFTAFVIILYRRWKDGENDDRLAHHYDLPLPVSQIIDTKKLTKEKSNTSEHNFVSIRSIVRNYLEM